MSVKVMGRVWDADLDPNLKMILLAYADAAEHDGTEIWPGWERIAKMTGYSRSTVARLTAKLLKSGVLVQVSEGRRGSRATYLIDLKHPTLKAIEDETLSPELGYQDETLSPETKEVRVSRVRPLPSYEAEESFLRKPKRSQIHRENFSAFYAFERGETYSPDAPLTESEQYRINGAAKEATKAGITADEIRERGERYRAAWTVARTAQGLLRNWGTFSVEAVEAEAACRHRWEDGRTALFTVESTEGNYTRCGRCPEKRIDVQPEPVSAPPDLRVVES